MRNRLWWLHGGSVSVSTSLLWRMENVFVGITRGLWNIRLAIYSEMGQEHSFWKRLFLEACDYFGSQKHLEPTKLSPSLALIWLVLFNTMRHHHTVIERWGALKLLLLGFECQLSPGLSLDQSVPLGKWVKGAPFALLGLQDLGHPPLHTWDLEQIT